jgi:hypothetical protein
MGLGEKVGEEGEGDVCSSEELSLAELALDELAVFFDGPFRGGVEAFDGTVNTKAVFGEEYFVGG